MGKIRTLLALGVLTSIMPYLGFPYALKNFLITLAGLAIIYIACVLYAENKKALRGEETFENFSENNDFAEKILIEEEVAE